MNAAGAGGGDDADGRAPRVHARPREQPQVIFLVHLLIVRPSIPEGVHARPREQPEEIFLVHLSTFRLSINLSSIYESFVYLLIFRPSISLSSILGSSLR